MSRLSFSLASSSEEVEEAFNLAYSIFKNTASIDQYKEFKLNLWQEDPSFDLENFVIARDSGGLMCGLVRIVPRKIFRGNKSFSVAGISSVCLAPSHQGKGLSVPFIEYALEICRQRNFDFAFLFARRDVDYYYAKIGFHGVSSYTQIEIKSSSPSLDYEFELGPSSEKYSEIYRLSYDQCYSHCFGRVERTADYWNFLIRKFQINQSPHLDTLYLSGVAIGYIIWSATTVHELAFMEGVSVKGLINFLNIHLTSPAKNDCVTFEMSPQHLLLGGAHGLDITMKIRECNFGGHMACILNPGALIDRIAERSPRRASELESMRELRSFGHSETCNLLGALTITGQENSNDTLLPFNVSFADQF